MTNKFLIILFLLCAGFSFSAMRAVAQTPSNAKQEVDEREPISLCWSKTATNLPNNPLASDNNILYVASEAGSVQAVDAATSTSIWKSELGGKIASNILATERSLFIATMAVSPNKTEPPTATLRALSSETGITTWATSIPYSDGMTIGRVRNSIVLVTDNGNVLAFDVAKGTQMWRFDAEGLLSSPPAFNANSVTFGLLSKKVISIADGEKVFDTGVKFKPTSVFVTDNNVYLIGDDRGNVSALHSVSKNLVWKFKSGGGVSNIALVNDSVIVTSLDNFVYSIWMYNGDVIWKKRMSGRVTDGFLASDEFVFVLVYGESSSFWIDVKNGKTIGRLDLKERNYLLQKPVQAASNVIFANSDQVLAYGRSRCEIEK